MHFLSDEDEKLYSVKAIQTEYHDMTLERVLFWLCYTDC